MSKSLVLDVASWLSSIDARTVRSFITDAPRCFRNVNECLVIQDAKGSFNALSFQIKKRKVAYTTKILISFERKSLDPRKNASVTWRSSHGRHDGTDGEATQSSCLVDAKLRARGRVMAGRSVFGFCFKFCIGKKMTELITGKD